MARSNVEATLIVLDIGGSVSDTNKGDSLSFFEKSCSCIIRIIERKIFSRPKDLIGIVVMGSKESNNDLAADGESYQHISIATELKTPSWSLIDTLRNKIKPTPYRADWLDALAVAADFLSNELIGQKISHKKIVLMTDLKSCPEVGDDELEVLINGYKESEYELIVIGPDIWIDNDESEPSEKISEKTGEQIKSELILKKFILLTDGLACSFEEAILQLMFHKKKMTSPQAWNIDLCISPNIIIPVSGYGKIRDSKSLGAWKKSYKNLSTVSTESVVTEKSYFKTSNTTDAIDELDIVSGYTYGKTLVPFTRLDNSMKYEAGEKCLSVHCFTKNDNIHWNDLSGDGVTYVVARKGDENACTALDALVTVLDKNQLVAIARKIRCKNAAPNMVVLFPIIENDYKCLSMVTLAFKDDYRHMTFPSLNQKRFPLNSDQIQAVDMLIDSMDLMQAGKDDEEAFLMEKTVNPAIQHFLDTISHRAIHPKEPLPPLRPEVQEFLEVPPMVEKLCGEPLEKVKNTFELVIKEKSKGGKHWVNKRLQADDKLSNFHDVPYSTAALNVTSVVTKQIRKVGTVNPADDFKELLSYGEPLNMVCEQLSEVIEKLVLLSYGDDYLKSFSAFKVMRDECVLSDPSFYNTWLTNFKCVLLERFKTNVFQKILDSNLGLITDNENSSSTVNDNDVKLFGNVSVDESLSKPERMDTTDIDDLFDD